MKWFYHHMVTTDDRVTVEHASGKSILRLENDLAGTKFFLENGPELSEEDMDELRVDVWRYEGSQYSATMKPKYRSKDPL